DPRRRVPPAGAAGPVPGRPRRPGARARRHPGRAAPGRGEPCRPDSAGGGPGSASTAGHRRRHRLPGPGRGGRRAGQERAGARGVVSAGLRLRRAGDRDQPGAARQRPAAAVPAPRAPGDRQPDGLQQPGCGRPRLQAGRGRGGPRQPCRGRPAGHLPGQEQGHPAGGGDRGLPGVVPPAGRLRRLRGRQRLQPEHAGAPLAAGRRRAPGAGRHAGRRGRPPRSRPARPRPGQAGPRPERRRPRAAAERLHRGRRRWADRDQHHPGPGRRGWSPARRRGRGAVRLAVGGTGAAGGRLPDRADGAAGDRRRRHHDPGGRPGDAGRRCRPAPALQRLHLPRSGPGRRAEPAAPGGPAQQLEGM
ncbi:MAG: Dihydroorotate dehydrogenase (quinone), partial [uncultured Friedmanniella sp.]